MSHNDLISEIRDHIHKAKVETNSAYATWHFEEACHLFETLDKRLSDGWPLPTDWQPKAVCPVDTGTAEYAASLTPEQREEYGYTRAQ